jgi:glycosyltransferase involved in cell wall biosynthesis
VVVGVLSTSFPRAPGDFAGSFVLDDARRISGADADVEVVAAGDSAAGVTRVPEGDLMVTRISTGVGPPRSLFYGGGAPEALERGGPLAWIEALHFWAAMCREVACASPRWDRIVSHWLVPCGLAAISAAPRLPHRAYAHSGDVALLERLPFGGRLAEKIARSSADLIFISDDLKARFIALAGAETGRVEPLVPEPDLFRPVSAAGRAAARRRLGMTGPTVIAVGRLVPIKGFDLLIDACASLADLVIIGDGPERDKLRARARRRGVSLRLPGFLPRSEVPLWLSAADIYAQPSRRAASGRTEGLPVAALEAVAVGLPVVASRSGGLAELAERARGVTLFPPGDVPSLRRALSSRLAGGVPHVQPS